MENDIVKVICSPVKISCYDNPCLNIDIVEATVTPQQTMTQIEMKRKQREDPCIEKWKKALIDKKIIGKTANKIK